MRYVSKYPPRVHCHRTSYFMCLYFVQPIKLRRTHALLDRIRKVIMRIRGPGGVCFNIPFKQFAICFFM